MKITHEMLEAGIEAFAAHESVEMLGDVVTRVFEAMMAARIIIEDESPIRNSADPRVCVINPSEQRAAST
jgi:hypothetical protein